MSTDTREALAAQLREIALGIRMYGAPKGCYPEEWGPSSDRRLTCACGNPDPSHWETKK